MSQCDICIGKPEDWCDDCNTCIHQCQCDFIQEAADMAYVLLKEKNIQGAAEVAHWSELETGHE